MSPEDQILFARFGAGPVRAPTHALIHHAFEERATATPDAIAVEHLGETITYQDLDRQANALATLLMTHGIRAGDRVALFLQRSIPMVVGILATLKAGAAYVPQHVGVAPDAQLRHVAQTSNARVILTLSTLRANVPAIEGVPHIEIDAFMRTHETIAPFPPRVLLSPSSGCFVLFTSGTTGIPNGVEVTHANVTNLLLTAPGDLDIQPGDRVAQILSIAFDMAAWEILGCLAHGGTLVIRGKSIADAVRRANVVIATPSILAQVPVDDCHHVKVVAVAGEPCPRPLADAWAAFATFYNGCGPTEVTIVNTMQHHLPTNARLTIGAPTPNNTVYILDEALRPLPIGEVGEMWAGGDCVSTGYLANDELNADRYRHDPFLGGARKMFRTRDLGRWTPDGQLEHLGRTDDQVKVRGFRVELDSVSRILESTPGCTQAVTLKLDDRTLVAFVAPADVDVEAARTAAASRLPYYAVPAAVHALPTLPLTSRGKIDKQYLMSLAGGVS
ncbi:MAG: amino acid adenylation domain-containing protein [Myxococcota bacterium]|nr:amino acid adenylation domain-containing protein [Myxococcota bacterium]